MVGGRGLRLFKHGMKVWEVLREWLKSIKFNDCQFDFKARKCKPMQISSQDIGRKDIKEEEAVSCVSRSGKNIQQNSDKNNKMALQRQKVLEKPVMMVMALYEGLR